MRAFELAIFDLDGTLLNTIDDLAVAANRALRLRGYPEHPADAYKLFVGDGLRKMLTRALPPEHRDTAAILEGVEAVFDEYYAVHGQDLTKPYDGIPELLETLRADGVKIAVLSNKPNRFIPALMDRYFPGRIDIAFGQREHIPEKPDPAAAREILAAMKAAPSRTVYIGDSGTDMDTAVNAGLPPVGVTWGFRTKEELLAHGARYIIDKPSELLAIALDK